MFRSLLRLAFLAACPETAHADCGLALVLAMDVSSSIDEHEYALQRHGLAEAFRDPEIVDAILALDGGVLVAVTQWGSPGQQELSLGWTGVTSAGEASELADRLDALADPFLRSTTAVGNALRHSGEVLASAPDDCARKVVDIASDGTSNSGLLVAPEADLLAARGVTVNALLIEAFPEMIPWYVRHVLRGPDAFYLTTPSYREFPEAIRRKLLRELRPQVAMR